ncbi:MAG: hypothetical protein E7482_00930 [Ruminococcaceae bacterium]|nr:hypothetical protein [Oscillospiraceae bacterium]
MRGNEFLEKIGLIAPEYIEEAEEKQKRRKNLWIKWLAAAACICILAGVVLSVDFYEPPQEPETSAPGEVPPNLTENGIKYFISPYADSVYKELPEGFAYAGETDAGGFENCPYYVNPDMPEWVFVYHEVRTNGEVDSSGTIIPAEPHDAYVRYVDERLRGKDLVCVSDDYYISMWSAKPYGDNPDVSAEYYDEMETKYGVRIEGEPPEGFVLSGTTEFSGHDTVPKGNLVSNEGEFEVYANPDNPEVIYVSTFWYTHTAEEKTQTKREGFNVYIKYDCPFAE